MNTFYSQKGQDLLVTYFFKNYSARQNLFLDVGAFDGIGYSNTRLFFEQGWRGICVEPVSKNFKKLESLYRGTDVITIRAAAADYEGEMVLNVATIPWDKDWGSDVSSLSEDALERWPEYVWEKETVPAITLNKLLELNGFKDIDFVSIDVEGHEMSVLRGFDLKKFRPLLLVVEYSNIQERKDLICYMKNQEYFLWVDNGQDIFFARGTVLSKWKVLPYGIWLKFSAGKPWQILIRSGQWIKKKFSAVMVFDKH